MTENSTNSCNNNKPSQNEKNRVQAIEAPPMAPIQMENENMENISEKEKTNAENEQKMNVLLQTMNAESAQLGEFLAVENKLMIELCTSFAQILKRVKVSFSIPPQDLPLKAKAKKVTLDENGHLAVFYEKQGENSAFLSEYPPEIVMAVLYVVIPEFTRFMAVYRRRVGARVSFFEGIKKELKNVAKAIIGPSEENKKPEAEQNQDVAKELSKPEKLS
jgi:hypothetical protein